MNFTTLDNFGLKNPLDGTYPRNPHAYYNKRRSNMAKENWKKLEANYWKPEIEGEELVGKVASIKSGQFGKQYVIDVDDGTQITTPSHKVLQNRMESIEEGDVVKIVFTGYSAPSVKGQSPTCLYDVYKKE